jgi:hypothetical protein
MTTRRALLLIADIGCDTGDMHFHRSVLGTPKQRRPACSTRSSAPHAAST